MELRLSNVLLACNCLTRLVGADDVNLAGINKAQLALGRKVGTVCQQVVVREQPFCCDALRLGNRVAVVAYHNVVGLSGTCWSRGLRLCGSADEREKTESAWIFLFLCRLSFFIFPTSCGHLLPVVGITTYVVILGLVMVKGISLIPQLEVSD